VTKSTSTLAVIKTGMGKCPVCGQDRVEFIAKGQRPGGRHQKDVEVADRFHCQNCHATDIQPA
jgi:transposase-like protein